MSSCNCECNVGWAQGPGPGCQQCDTNYYSPSCDKNCDPTGPSACPAGTHCVTGKTSKGCVSDTPCSEVCQSPSQCVKIGDKYECATYNCPAICGENMTCRDENKSPCSLYTKENFEGDDNQPTCECRKDPEPDPPSQDCSPACEDNETCFNNECFESCGSDESCGSGESCYDSKCMYDCDDNSDCNKGETCNSSKVCVPGDSNNQLAIILGSVGGVVALAIIVGFIIYFYNNRKSKTKNVIPNSELYKFLFN